MINVTKTYLPSREKYKEYVDEIYASGWITNNGIMVQRLEKRLAEYLGVKNIVLVANGTLALEIAYRTLDIKGSVITTPFSFVATTSSLVTNGLNPIFADIDAQTLCINPNNIESLITPNTSAILPVHIFGNTCEVEAIDDIAKRHNLKVIYDAAQAFGIEYKGDSLLKYGDISTLSFHATKIFHTIEGGALIINDDHLVKKARYLMNFGIKNAESIPELGINAKMNEFEAAMGLCMLDEMDNVLKRRKEVYRYYKEALKNIVSIPHVDRYGTKNYSYFPIVLRDEVERLTLQKALNSEDIYPRRYFYPSLDTLNYINPKQFMPISRDISTRVLALPIYPDIQRDIQEKIIEVIIKIVKDKNG
jgi:dTDP-4-amino-4,6-dideoxygalactose transaminase